MLIDLGILAEVFIYTGCVVLLLFVSSIGWSQWNQRTDSWKVCAFTAYGHWCNLCIDTSRL